MRVIVTGGTGMIGQALCAGFAADGHDTIALGRHPARAKPMPDGVRVVAWDGMTSEGWGGLVDGADVIVNLAGESIGGNGLLSILFGRWTREQKLRIVESRSNAGRAIVEAVRSAGRKPGLLIQPSASGYYGATREEELTEGSGAGDDFLARTCLEWEAASEPVVAYGVRRIVIRSGVVLSLRGGTFPMLVLPFRFFLGGPLGSGRQWFPWVHLTDEVGAIRFLMAKDGASGVYNLTAPETVRNADVARMLGSVMRRPAFFRVPGFVLRLMMGEKATLVLDGQRPVPKRLLEAGYVFRFPTFESALRDLLR